MRRWAIEGVPGRGAARRGVCLLLASACLLLSGCAALLYPDYHQSEPHANRYWEDSGNEILRAESYQDLVNTLLLLVEQHADTGLLRLYLTDVDYITALDMMKKAIAEVQLETAMGSYALESMDFDMEELRNSYYQVELTPAYRRTAEEAAAIQKAASSSSVYELARSAWERGQDGLTVRYAYQAETPEEIRSGLRLLQIQLEEIPVETLSPEEPPVQEETPAEEGESAAPAPEAAFPEGYTPWTVQFYPPEGESTIVEILFFPGESLP